MKREYLDHEFYQIVTRENGEKWIQFDGYYYESEDALNGCDGRIVEYSDAEMPLSEFLAKREADQEGLRNNLKELFSQTKQYTQDILIKKEPGMYDVPPVELCYEDIDMNTPIGLYIDYGKEIEEELER